MHILIVITETAQRFLVKIEEDEQIEEIKHLVKSRKRKKAMLKALSKGRIIKELADREHAIVAADLTLTKNGAYWDKL